MVKIDLLFWLIILIVILVLWTGKDVSRFIKRKFKGL